MEHASLIKRMDVMIVDPDVTSRGNLAALARDFGCYEVRPFDNAHEAMISILVRVPKVVFCEWGKDGKEPLYLLEHIRNNPAAAIAKTPILIVNRQMNREQMSRAIQAGATQFIEFPIVPSDLMAKLVFVLKDSRQTNRQKGQLHYITPVRSKNAKKMPPVPDIVEYQAEDVAQDGEDADDILEV